MNEALEMLDGQGRHVDALRVRGFPFADAVGDFIADAREVFVVEQNRDGQLRTLIMNEIGVDPAKLVPVLTTTARRSPPGSSPARSPPELAARPIAEAAE